MRQPRSASIVTKSFRRSGIVSLALFALSAISGFAHAGELAYPTPQARPGQPMQGLTALQLQRFVNGRNDYSHTFIPAEGLGPIFNKASCGNCHNNPLGGPGSQTVTRFGATGKDGFDPLTALGGSLLQALSIDAACQEFIPPESNHNINRVTNGSQGYGLIEAIADADLIANRNAQPAPQQGVLHMVGTFEDPEGAPLRVGRFGWKAQLATILSFSADAAQNEIGLSNRFIPFDNAPNGNIALLNQFDLIADPEDGPDAGGLHFIDRVTDFQRYLTHPPQTPRSGMTGETIFNAIGCAVCHTPSFTTKSRRGLEAALAGKVIRPYSDFLLHNMGQAADFVSQGDAGEQMMKTPVLWGVRTRDPMWHDGRVAAGTFASRINAAIAEHGAVLSQGAASASAYAALSANDKNLVIAFLDSLGRVEFDADGDEDVDIFDFNTLKACYGPGPVSPDAACAVHDIDQNGAIDMIDAGSFLIASGMPRRDCNNNGVTDLIDILNGAADTDNDGFPDVCEPTCAADVTGGGQINVTDLLAVISGWGTCPAVPAPCKADINGDQQTNVTDLLAVISAWGVCP